MSNPTIKGQRERSVRRTLSFALYVPLIAALGVLIAWLAVLFTFLPSLSVASASVGIIVGVSLGAGGTLLYFRWRTRDATYLPHVREVAYCRLRLETFSHAGHPTFASLGLAVLIIAVLAGVTFQPSLSAASASVGIIVGVSLGAGGTLLYLRRGTREATYLPPLEEIVYSLPRPAARSRTTAALPREGSAAERRCIRYLRSQLNLSDKVEVSYGFDFGSPELSHRFDLLINDLEKVYLVEVKSRPILPSDIVNLSKLSSLLLNQQHRIPQVVVCTSHEPSPLVKTMSEQTGIRIVTTA